MKMELVKYKKHKVNNSCDRIFENVSCSHPDQTKCVCVLCPSWIDCVLLCV